MPVVQTDIQINPIVVVERADFGCSETFKLFARNYLNLKLQIAQANGLCETLGTLGKLIKNLKTLRS